MIFAVILLAILVLACVFAFVVYAATVVGAREDAMHDELMARERTHPRTGNVERLPR